MLMGSRLQIESGKPRQFWYTLTTRGVSSKVNSGAFLVFLRSSVLKEHRGLECNGLESTLGDICRLLRKGGESREIGWTTKSSNL